MVHCGNTKAPTEMAKVRRRRWKIFCRRVERFFFKMLNGFRERVKSPDIF
jgi:hypothetical protein